MDLRIKRKVENSKKLRKPQGVIIDVNSKTARKQTIHATSHLKGHFPTMRCLTETATQNLTVLPAIKRRTDN